jgi:putative membrane protein
MFAGAWCGQLGVGGWVLMGLFWATFLGLVLWAVSRLFGSGRVAGGVEGDKREVDDVDDLDLRLARGELDVTQYRTLRDEPTSSRLH